MPGFVDLYVRQLLNDNSDLPRSAELLVDLHVYVEGINIHKTEEQLIGGGTWMI